MSMGSSQPSSIDTWTPGQQLVAQNLYKVIQGGLGKPMQSYSGQIVPGLDQGYGQARDALSQYNPQQFAAGQSGAINQALSGQPSYQLDPATTANWYQNSVANPALRNYQQNVAPQIDQGFAGTGGLFSTARGFAQQNALSNMQAQNSAQLAQQQMQNQGLSAQLAESARNRQLQGVGLANQQQNQPLFAAQAMEQALQPFQQNAQQQSAANYQEWLRTRPENSPYTQDAFNFLQNNGKALYQRPDNTSALLGGGMGLLGTLLGGPLGGLLGGSLGGLFGGGLGGGGSGGGVDIMGNPLGTTYGDALSQHGG